MNCEIVSGKENQAEKEELGGTHTWKVSLSIAKEFYVKGKINPQFENCLRRGRREET